MSIESEIKVDAFMRAQPIFKIEKEDKAESFLQSSQLDNTKSNSNDDNQTIMSDGEEEIRSLVQLNMLVKKNQREKKVYKCEYEGCPKVYRSRENLKLHIQNIHKKQKPYQCNYCVLRFSHRNGRIYHERKVHTLYFPYKCPMENCSSSFPCKSALNFHLKSNHQQNLGKAEIFERKKIDIHNTLQFNLDTN